MAKHVAIVGAGPSGLVTLKEALAEGLDATIFEASPHIGGQWHYSEPDGTTGLGGVHSSVYKGAVFNSCRDTTHFSDFPMDPARYADYTTQFSFIKYVHEYVDYFGLLPHIRLNSRVVDCRQVEEDKWIVTVKKAGGELVTETFDGLFVALGHNTTPHIPEFEGLKDYKGKFMHSHVYRTPGPFDGKRVAVIGMGSSAIDISCEICPGADETHVIARNPGYVLPRYVLGAPTESYDSRLPLMLPTWLAETIQSWLYRIVVGKLPESIQPNHGLLEANPNIRGDFVEKVTVGSIIAHKTGVERFTENGLLLSNGEKLDVDVVIACTGYWLDFPFLPEDSWHAKDSLFIQSKNATNLYENIVSLDYKNLFFIGIVEIFGAVIPIAEIQARYSVAVTSGRIALPSREEMVKWIQNFQKSLRKYPKSDRHTFTVENAVAYADEMLRPLGANPTFGRLLKKVFTSNPIRAFGILNTVYMSVMSPAQFRLFGHGAKPELAAATLSRVGKGKKGLSSQELEGLELWRSAALAAAAQKVAE